MLNVLGVYKTIPQFIGRSRPSFRRPARRMRSTRRVFGTVLVSDKDAVIAIRTIVENIDIRFAVSLRFSG